MSINPHEIEAKENVTSELQDSPETTPDNLAHSGKLGLESPVTEFSTPLDEAVRKGYVSATPDNAEHLTTPHDTVQEKNKKSRLKYVVGGALVAVAAAGAFLSLKESDKKDESVPTSASNLGLPEVPTTLQGAQIQPITSMVQEVQPAITNPETASLHPVLMDGSSAEEVIAQFYENYHCMTNSSSQEIQSECMDNILGMSRGNLYDLYTEHINEVALYRQKYPLYTQHVSYEIIDTTYSNTETEITYKQEIEHRDTENGTIADGDGVIYRRIKFTRVNSTDEQKEAGAPGVLWAQISYRVISENETNIG